MYPGSDVRAVERALAAYYEQEASDRAKRPIAPQRVGARTRFITQLDGRQPRVLEVGVGPGRDAASFVAEGIPVVGVDLSVEHAQRASSTGVHAVVATVRRLPFGTSAFAALWTMSTLMHVPNEAITDALAELRRVLAPRALAAVGVWGGPDVEHHLGIDDFDPPRFFSLRSDERWRSLLSTLGSVEDFGDLGSARQRLLVPVGHRPNDLTSAPTIATDAHARPCPREVVGQVHRFGIVVIDPVRAFTDPAGVIGRVHPADQFSLIVETVERLSSFAAAQSGPKVWVTSLYAPGQFSGGDMGHPLAHLCTDASSVDCAWDPRLVPPADALVVTKTDMDAGSCLAFVEATEAMVGDVDAVLVTGFWLSACVAATAASCAQRLAGRVPVVVPLSLAATRLGLYDPGDDHPAVVDVTTRLAQLRADGVVVCDAPDAWKSELTDR